MKIIKAVLMVILLTAASITNGQEPQFHRFLDPGWLCDSKFEMEVSNRLNMAPQRVVVQGFIAGREHLQQTGRLNYELPAKLVFYPTLKKIPNPLLVKVMIGRSPIEKEDDPNTIMYEGIIKFGKSVLPIDGPGVDPSIRLYFGKNTRSQFEILQTYGFILPEHQRLIMKFEK